MVDGLYLGGREGVEPDAAAVAQRRRLGRDDRPRRRVRARVRGRGRQAVPDPLLVDGADAPLREAGRLVRGQLQRPRDRESARVPVQRSEARSDRRLQDTPEGGAMRRRRRRHDVREATDRPAGRPRLRARRPGLHQRQEARTSPTSIRRSATTRPPHGRRSGRATTSSSATTERTRAIRERGERFRARASSAR